MTEPIRIHYGLSMRDGVGPRGLDRAALDALAERFVQARQRVQARVDGGELGFWTLPHEGQALAEVRALRARLPAEATDVLWLGIGGSSLGARALLDALAAPAEADTARPRVHLPDNSDPWLLSHLLAHLRPERTVAAIVSKSGGTVETAAQMLIVRRWLEDALGAERAASQLVAITDPTKGSLRALADEHRWHSLPIPTHVGGRFSVLTAVGLLPAALRGFDAEALLAGAAAMAARCERDTLAENPAGILATLHYLHDTQYGHHIHVMMPYSDRLRAFADWYVQLWAESLGKRYDNEGTKREVGPTPLAAVGATDQHAQMQLFMEGPRNKLITFVEVRETACDLEIPESGGDASYLGGKTLGELLAAERRGSTEALAQDGRPSLTVQVPRLDAHAMGQLLFLYQAATAFAGELYEINAFDQPGVELGKRLAFGLLGRRGYEKEAATLEASQSRERDAYVV